MKKQLLFWIGIISLFLFTRLFNLLIIPIFTDEAIYTYWAQIALHDPANRFISLEDGKQPLFIWSAAIFQNFLTDPLLATRLVSVLSGLGSTVGIYLLSKMLFNQKVAILSSLLYIILPLTLLYDRMALFDSLLTMFGIYSVFFTVKLVKDPRLDLAMLTGISIGLSTLTKSSGAFFLYTLPFSLLLFNFRDKNIGAKFFKWAVLASLVFVISQIVYNSLRLSPLFYIIGQKNLTFIKSFPEFIESPFQYFKSNLNSMISWIIDYIGLGLFVLLPISIIYAFFKKNNKILYLSVLIFAPFVAELLFNKVLYPRFMLFYFPYVIILISFAIVEINDLFGNYQKYFQILILIFFIYPVTSSWNLLTNPTIAKIPGADAGQYINDWPAGYGVAETVDIFKRESENEEIFVATEGTFGLLPFAIRIYFFGDSNVQISGFWPVDENNLPQQILDVAKSKKTFFIFNENQDKITNPQLRLLNTYQKGKGTSYMRLYEVIP